MRDLLEGVTRNAALMNLIFSAVVMAATVVYAILTAALVRETRRMRSAQTDPDMAVYLEHDENSIGVLHFVIRNIGSGPAYELKFELKDMRMTDWAADSIQRLSLWEKGLPYLAPGSSIKTVAGAVFQEGAKDFTLTVTVSYGTADGSRRSSTYVLDFVNYTGITQLGEPPMKKLVKEIEAIRRTLEKQSSPRWAGVVWAGALLA